MDILIDNQNIESVYGIKCLDWRPILGIAGQRNESLTWNDKSGIDVNLSNARLDSYEFVLEFMIQADTISIAYNRAKTLIEYMLSKRVFILSLRETGFREAFLCSRSTTIVPHINIRNVNSLYVFKIGFIDVNQNAIKYYATSVLNSVTISYTKGQTAPIYLGNGTRAEVSNSGNYTYTLPTGLIDIIIDVDKDAATVLSLVCNFIADITNGIKIQDVQFTDTSTGAVEIWLWDFGDGGTSSEQNPLHTYIESGIYTVTLQVFNSAKGFSTMTKTNYISIRNARMLVSDSNDFALSGNGFGNIN
ncbi:MAG: PKD domain-containing protein [Bacteroidales bacterium]|nr:PKD domain-containing protein [Bacteroidales bacterium]